MQKHVNLVDLVKSFPTNMYLQKSASIQPRTSLVKFARSPRADPPGLACPCSRASQHGSWLVPDTRYALGLLGAFLALALMKMGQPALLSAQRFHGIVLNMAS